MTSLFFWIAAGMTALALAMLVSPLLSGRSGRDESGDGDDLRRRENIAAARRRMRELRARKEQGEISDDDFSEARAEIERSLLDDLATESERRVARIQKTEDSGQKTMRVGGCTSGRNFPTPSCSDSPESDPLSPESTPSDSPDSAWVDRSGRGFNPRPARGSESEMGSGFRRKGGGGKAGGVGVGVGWVGVICVLLPVAAGGLYFHLGEPRGLELSDWSGAPVAVSGTGAGNGSGDSGESGGSGMPPIGEAIAGLRRKLEADPDNLAGWTLLARALAATGRPGEAAEAFRRARLLAGDDADLLAGEAEARARAAGGFSGEPVRLLGMALGVDAAHGPSLWLSGLAAAERGEHRAAADFWRRARLRIEDDAAREQLDKLIAEAEKAAEAPVPGGDAGDGERP